MTKSIILLLILTPALIAAYYRRRDLKALLALTAITGVAGIAFAAIAPPVEQPRQINRQLLDQQEAAAFAAWEQEYRADVADMRRQAVQYQSLLDSFRNDEISIEHTLLKLRELEPAGKTLEQKYRQINPDADFKVGNAAIIKTIQQKTLAVAAKQSSLLQKLITAIQTPEFKAARHDEQANTLEKILLAGNPPYLNIAAELKQLQDNIIPQTGRSN